jgi:rubrerythrin
VLGFELVLAAALAAAAAAFALARPRERWWVCSGCGHARRDGHRPDWCPRCQGGEWRADEER